jgi:hypothetical protein
MGKIASIAHPWKPIREIDAEQQHRDHGKSATSVAHGDPKIIAIGQ